LGGMNNSSYNNQAIIQSIVYKYILLKNFKKTPIDYSTRFW
jgi:hypothetical protein